MKKILSITLLSTLALAAFSCSDSDDDSSNSSNCKTCETAAAGVSVSTEYCDNGDGTMTTTVNGILASDSIAIPGGNFNTYITGLQAAGVNCN